MSLASRTRAAVRANPFLYDALRAGVVNYTGAARFLDLGADDEEAVVAALRRYAEDLSAYERPAADARVSMQSGVGEGDPAEALLAVGETAIVPDGGSQTALLATGTVDAAALSLVLGRLAAEGIDVVAAGVAGDALVVAIERLDGPDALRVVEGALSGEP